MKYFTDVHSHLQDDAFDKNLSDVIARAKSKNVLRFICNSTSPGDWQKVQALAEKYKEIIPCFGVHPWFVDKLAKDWDAELERLLDSLQRKDGFRVSIGEIGLDYAVEPRNNQLQEQIFRRQLQIARKLCLPITVHSVRAVSRICEMLKDEGPIPAVLLHSFSGPVDRIKELVKLGCYFSFSAHVLNPVNRRARESIPLIPADRIMFESDAPRTEPDIIPDICAEISALRNVSFEEMEQIVFANVSVFFKG